MADAIVSRERLADFHRIASGIRRWRTASDDAAKLIREAHEKQIWTPKYKSFRAFCEQECGITRQWAYELMKTAHVMEQLGLPAGEKTHLDGHLNDVKSLDTLRNDPANLQQKPALGIEGQLSGTTGEMDSHRKAPSEGGVASRSLQQSCQNDALSEVDKTGTRIPLALLEDWHRAEQFAEQLRKLSDVKCFVDDALQASDPIFREITNTVIAEMNNVYGTLRRVLPYAVCPTCAGHRSAERCGASGLCKGRGFISKFLWDSTVPSEIKEMRVR